LIDGAKTVDKRYIPTRYPSGFDPGASMDFYTEEDAGKAIRWAEEIPKFCRHQIS
jgi:HEPN domain-containing protein